MSWTIQIRDRTPPIAECSHHTVKYLRSGGYGDGKADDCRIPCPLFHSDKFNICADETFDLGKGKSRAYCEEKGVGNAYVEYVSQLCSYVKTLGCTPMMWGDIIVKYPDLLSQIPEDTIFLTGGMRRT